MCQKFSLSLTNSPFTELINAIEQKSDFRFYFEPRWADSLQVSISTVDQDLKQILNDVLQPTSYSFTITINKEVIITQNAILSTLPGGVFPSPGNPIDENTNVVSPFDKKVKKSIDEVNVLIIGTRTSTITGTAIISGFVKDRSNGEPIPGVSIFQQDPFIGTATDLLGKYSLTLPKGKKIITIQSVGMKTTHRTVMLYGEGKLDIELDEEITPLKEIIVNSDREISVTGLQMGREKLDIRSMRQMPLALGETDVMKIVLTLPGVQTVGEGSNGLNVRGGASNQNLILFNGATIYNPSHLFGFFSTFNPDVLKGLELFKSGLEASMGGRLSAVLDVTSREGNSKKFSATGGISPVTGRLTWEGPIIKNKTSFLLAGRTTYSDWILSRLDSRQFQNSNASFYDLNMNIGHHVNDNNHLTLSGYASRDQFKFNSDTLYQYLDQNSSLKWFHRFNAKLFGELFLTGSDYQFSITSKENPKNAFVLKHSVQQYQVKADFNFIANKKHTLQAGLSSIFYKLKPGSYLPLGDSSIVRPDRIETESGVESAIYAGDNFEVTNKLSVYVGFRYSVYSYLGSKNIFQYNPGSPIEESSIVDTTHYGHGIIKTYGGLEPRLSARYILGKSSSLKISFGRTRQYIQMLSNNTAISPTDIWKLSDVYIKPQIADQLSIGWFKNFTSGAYEFSTEAYYKNLINTTDFQNGAVLIRNHHLETDVLNAGGKAYGTEFMIKKSAGRLNGWLSYTWSRSLLKVDGIFDIEKVNNGEYYPSNFDKPHAVNLVSNYKLNRRINISLNIVYSTGRPITLPIAKYEMEGVTRVLYSDRNEFRVPDYFRSDISINIEGNHKIKKLAHNSFTIAVYNLTGRRNAYSIFFRSEDAQIKGYKLSIFGQAIPTLTYNFKI